MKSWTRSVTQLIVLAGALALAGCATTPQPNSALEDARQTVERVAANPDVNRLAAVELREAREKLGVAEGAWSDRAEQSRVDHLAFLARRQAELAEEAARARRLDQRLDELRGEREQVRLEARAARAEREARYADERRALAETRAAEFERQTAEMRAEAEHLQQQLAELEARPTERGLVLTLGSDVLFDFDRYELKPGAERTVERIAQFLNEYPERQVLVEGFTDSVGSREYNMGLSERRANAVRTALVERGVDPGRISIRGFGPDFPVASNDSEAGRQLNRRVEVIISDDDAAVPERRN